VVPPPVQPMPVPRTEPSAAFAAGSADAAALWRAFCEGAGLRLDPPQGLNPELMRVIGQLLHAGIEGTLQLMAVRAATKHELRAQVTVIQSRNNNPLKFSPDAQSALEQLLQPPVRGFLPGPAAMSDAMHDLVGHAIGTMAGTRAALEGVLARFQPEALEAKLVGRSMLDSVLPLNRKAKLWELYLQHFDAIREEAQEDFHNLFGRAFLAAYEEQLQRLHERKSAA
jgi:FHA domain-containing protein